MPLHTTPYQLSNEWIDVLEKTQQSNGLIPYEYFSNEALFHKKLGYYQQNKQRVGKDLNSDFYTSTSHKEVFPELITDATRHLIEKHNLPTDCFYEVGAEPEQDQWNMEKLPYSSHQIIRLDEVYDIRKNGVIYSNELFDAQPFQRWVAVEGKWLPVSLKMEKDHIWEVAVERDLTEQEQACFVQLPQVPAFEYHIDVSWQAKDLLRSLISDRWRGLFIAIDYGRTFAQLTQETPQGTARAFSKHKQVEQLFVNPGNQDLTIDVCWDPMEDELQSMGFSHIKLQSQSRFFMENATVAIEKIVKSSEGLTSKKKSQLLELISPGFFGQRFQVLTAVR